MAPKVNMISSGTGIHDMGYLFNNHYETKHHWEQVIGMKHDANNGLLSQLLSMQLGESDFDAALLTAFKIAADEIGELGQLSRLVHAEIIAGNIEPLESLLSIQPPIFQRHPVVAAMLSVIFDLRGDRDKAHKNYQRALHEGVPKYFRTEKHLLEYITSLKEDESSH